VIRILVPFAVGERARGVGGRARAPLERIGAARPAIGGVRGRGPLVAHELAERSGDAARAVTTAARERGLVLLSCGLYGNVIRILVPLVISDDDLDRGLDILEEALGDADGGR
jgi:4-aminobutyrate aminotransferase/(S)-3-amino-2-methylpropionate transaminase